MSSTAINHSDKAHEAEVDDRVKFGFWVYLMTDLLMFAVIFAVYAVQRNSTAGGPSGGDLFSPSLALTETLILLTSSFTAGIAMIAARNLQKAKTMVWFGITFLLGAAFLGIELYEFAEFIHE